MTYGTSSRCDAMKDIIKVSQTEYKKTVLRKATGTVRNQLVFLRLEVDEKYPKYRWVSVYEKNSYLGSDDRLELACFRFPFFANNYFDKLVRKYNLIEEDPKVKSSVRK